MGPGNIKHFPDVLVARAAHASGGADSHLARRFRSTCDFSGTCAAARYPVLLFILAPVISTSHVHHVHPGQAIQAFVIIKQS